ncbi:MAG: TIGR03745 family integrating conjugative element membrane protein [Herminiimonas sp.]|nr:TIGR03745 family integrating conjugative element membrane protein [Herminiimonas sp.]
MKQNTQARHGPHFIGQAKRALAAAWTSGIARQLAITIVATLSLFLVADYALAALPTALNPGGSAATGDYIGLIKEYWKKGVALLALIICALAFLSVGGGGLAKFNDFRAGKAEIGDLTLFAVLGVIVLVTTVYLLTTADGIIT